MLILTLKTDSPEAEIGLFNDQTELSYIKWQAHRALAESIHTKIKELLDARHKAWRDLEAIVVYKGPGSFTGLRIGISVANALADSLGTPIVSQSGKDWTSTGIKKILEGKDEKLALPDYGSEPKTTTPKK